MAVPLVSGPGLGDANAARKSTGTLPENQCDFDKVNHSLYNAFYQPFDEGIFVDTNYEVDTRNGTFILTSNFAAEAEIKQGLGTAMYSRNRETVAAYRRRFDQRNEGHVWGKTDDETFLTDIGALRVNENGELRPTRAGLLMFGEDRWITYEFPHFFLDYR